MASEQTIFDEAENTAGMDEEAGATEIRRVVIDPEGDVVLQLAEAELQVSSRALGLVSKVWKAMFSPRFSEGIALLKSQACPIPLEDDDALAMTTLCQVLHHSYRKIDRDISPEGLVDLAFVTDKYDCVEAMSQYSSCCLSEWLCGANEGRPTLTPYGIWSTQLSRLTTHTHSSRLPRG
ncbi:hypothetical protein MMC30_001935 [Trapelia coarctata]|nr:hypothetical protein [Trapelia coarctata]